jgi:hypothetical protein
MIELKKLKILLPVVVGDLLLGLLRQIGMIPPVFEVLGKPGNSPSQ